MSPSDQGFQDFLQALAHAWECGSAQAGTGEALKPVLQKPFVIKTLASIPTLADGQSAYSGDWSKLYASTRISLAQLTLSFSVRLVYESNQWAIHIVNPEPVFPWQRKKLHQVIICIEGMPRGQGRVYFDGHLWKRFGHTMTGDWYDS